jgi:hypothetical protein
VRSASLLIITDKASPKGRKVGGVGVMKDGEIKLDESLSHTRWCGGRSCPGEREWNTWWRGCVDGTRLSDTQ